MVKVNGSVERDGTDEQRLFNAVLLEYQRARDMHGRIHSPHEGFALMKEEVDELWDEVRKRKPDRVRMAIEAVQVAAVAIRFLVEVCRFPDVRARQPE